MILTAQFEENSKLKTVTSQYYNLIYSKIEKSYMRYGINKDNEPMFGFFGPEMFYLFPQSVDGSLNMSLERFVEVFHRILNAKYIHTNVMETPITETTYDWNDIVSIKDGTEIKQIPAYLEFFQRKTINCQSPVQVWCDKQSALIKINFVVDKLDNVLYNMIKYISIYDIDYQIILKDPTYKLSDEDVKAIVTHNYNLTLCYDNNKDIIQHNINVLNQYKNITILASLNYDQYDEIIQLIDIYTDYMWLFFNQIQSTFNQPIISLKGKSINKTQVKNIISHCVKNNIVFNFDQLSADLFEYGIDKNKDITKEDKQTFKQFITYDESGKFNCVIDHKGFLYKSITDYFNNQSIDNILFYKDFVNDVWLNKLYNKPNEEK